ncbi:MAG: aspartate kinase [Kiritimatiellae bacterium]|nr:aspartate kinase [Kiritimatiellia bacterium]
MALIIQKFGGTSVADPECLRRVAGRIMAEKKKGNQVVVIVSAMGDTTDELIALAHRITPEPDAREMDMLMSTGEQVAGALLAMALHAKGADAVSLTGPQAGIRTDSMHRRAKIMRINPRRIFRHLREGHIVIVAGFQGLTPARDIATLGRGGSDATAVALAAALKADCCQVFKDVDGVYSADPRIVPEARKLDEISYDEMLELAGSGAQVLMSRSVEFAKKYGVQLEVLSSFTNKPGTIVKEEVKSMEDIIVRGVSAEKNEVKITLEGVPDKPGIAAGIFRELAGASINIDMIIQNTSAGGLADISFTIPGEDLVKTKNLMRSISKTVGFKTVNFDNDIAKISVVGVGMRGHSGVAFRMFKTLAEESINILMISTSEIKISVVIRKKFANLATKALHQAFELGRRKK